MQTLKRLLEQHGADVAMSVIVVIWGLHFIVMKAGLSDIPPLTYNALRFTVALPVMLLVGLRHRAALRLNRRDLRWVVLVSVVGPLGYQIGFSMGLARTASTNTAILVATTPAWTALISILIGMVAIRRQLLLGIGVTLAGVVLVVLSRGGAELELSHDDLVGSALILGGTIVGAVGNILTKPVVDRLGGMALAIWTYTLTTLGCLILAGPDLITLTGDDVPVKVWPLVLYSGVLSSAGGFLAWNYAIKALGPTRAATYHNVPPIVAAVAGIVVMGDPLTAGLVIGGALTLWGVMVVRKHTFLRRLPRAEAAGADEP
jgi:drug/metabolite transporter (DMT)-like permease